MVLLQLPPPKTLVATSFNRSICAEHQRNCSRLGDVSLTLLLSSMQLNHHQNLTESQKLAFADLLRPPRGKLNNRESRAPSSKFCSSFSLKSYSSHDRFPFFPSSTEGLFEDAHPLGSLALHLRKPLDPAIPIEAVGFFVRVGVSSSPTKV